MLRVRSRPAVFVVACVVFVGIVVIAEPHMAAAIAASGADVQPQSSAPNGLAYLYQLDWRVFMDATHAWLQGQNPYGALSSQFGAGAFAYPPTALTWVWIFFWCGPFGFYLWTVLQLAFGWLLIRKEHRSHLLLLLWSPVFLNLWIGQNSLAIVLVLWGAARASQRGWLWGFALAWTLTKPQYALLPLLWIIWQDRAAPQRLRLWGGIIAGTLALALPPTLMNPQIWQDWLTALMAYRGRVVQLAAWQAPSVILVILAAYLWYRSRIGGWQWWLTAALLPYTSFYPMVMLLPMLRPRRDPWLLAGLGLAAVLLGPVNEVTLPWILSGHLLAAWMLARRELAAPALLR